MVGRHLQSFHWLKMANSHQSTVHETKMAKSWKKIEFPLSIRGRKKCINRGIWSTFQITIASSSISLSLHSTFKSPAQSQLSRISSKSLLIECHSTWLMLLHILSAITPVWKRCVDCDELVKQGEKCFRCGAQN